MPNSRQTSVMASPSRSRATKRRRSSITELAFHGIHTSRRTKAESVTHVSGTKCHLCLGPLIIDWAALPHGYGFREPQAFEWTVGVIGPSDGGSPPVRRRVGVARPRRGPPELQPPHCTECQRSS